MQNYKKVLSVVILSFLTLAISSAQIQQTEKSMDSRKEPSAITSETAKSSNSDGKKEIGKEMNNISETVKIRNNQTKPAKEKIVADAPLDPTRQAIIFRYEYSNNARIFQQQGWYMDKKGGVYKYSYERIFDSRDSHKMKFHLKFKVRPTLIAQVSPDVLAEKVTLIKKITSGTYTEKRAANDAGTGTVSLFSADAATGEYREIKLVTHGDYEGKNNSTETEELLEWLDSVIPEYTF